MRLFCFVCLGLLFATFARAQTDPDRRITFTHTGAPLSVLLPALSKETGVKLEASGQMGSQIVAVRLKEATLTDTMAKIVWATGGEWEKIDGGFRLILPAAALKALTTRDHEAQVTEIKKFMAKLPEDKGPLSAEEAQSIAVELNGMLKQKGGFAALSDEKAVRHMIDLSIRIPEVRVAIIAAHAIPPSELANIPIDTSVTYSSRPNRSQRMMPAKALADIASLRNDWVFWIKACNSIADEDERKQLLDQGGTHDAKALSQGAAKVLFRVFRSDSGIEFDLRELDANGKEILRLPLGTEDVDFLDADSRNGKGAPQSKEKLESSADAKEYSRIFGIDEENDSADPGEELLPRKWLGKIASDPNFEPLWLVGEELVRLAELEDRNLVANLSDRSLEETANWVVESSMNPEKLLDRLQGDGQQEVSRTEGWVTLRPTFPVLNDGRRCSRVALSHLVSTYLSKSRVGLVDLIHFAFESKAEPVFDSFDYTLISSLLDECGNSGLYSVMTTQGARLLRLLGALSADSIGRLEMEETLVFSTADEPARSMIIELLRSDDAPIKAIADSPEKADSEEPEVSRSDPTELFPNGIPPRIALRLSKKFEDVAVGNRGGEETPLASFSPREIANYMSESATTGLDTGGKNTRGNLYRMGVRTSWKFSVMLTNEWKVDYYVVDMEFDPKSPRMPYGSLPKAYRDEADKARAENSNIPPTP